MIVVVAVEMAEILYVYSFTCRDMDTSKEEITEMKLQYSPLSYGGLVEPCCAIMEGLAIEYFDRCLLELVLHSITVTTA